MKYKKYKSPHTQTIRLNHGQMLMLSGTGNTDGKLNAYKEVDSNEEFSRKKGIWQ